MPQEKDTNTMETNILSMPPVGPLDSESVKLEDALAKIISDAEIARVHGYANFGNISPREVVNDGVRKYAVGYHSGYTQLSILLEHGLITKPRPGRYEANLTKKGKAYARALNFAFARTTTPPTDPRLDRAIEALETIDAGGADVAPPTNKRSYAQGFDQGAAWAGRVARQALASIRGEA